LLKVRVKEGKMDSTSGIRRHGVLLAVATIASVLGLAACGGSDDSAAPAPETEVTETEVAPADTGAAAETSAAGLPEVCQGQSGEGLKVGFANISEEFPFTVQVREGLEKVAAECGLELIVADNDLDQQKVQANLRNFVTQEVDGVIQFPVDEASGPATCDLIEGIPVITIDIRMDPCAIFMGADNAAAGRLAGEALGNWAQENWDCEIDAFFRLESPSVGEVNTIRLDGQQEGFEGVCGPIASDKVKVIAGESIIEDVRRLTTDQLTALPNAERIAVVSIDDDSSLGATAAFEAAGRLDQAAIVGQGADVSSRDVIRDGTWVGSTAYFPERYADFLVPNIIRLINGQEVPDPILVEHVFIDQSNIDEYYPE
jgi:ribose transport system substrate-binding protein